MNQVSDFALAKAVRDAGAFPSISVFNYYTDSLNLDLLILDTQDFGSNFLLSLGPKELENESLVDFIIERQIKAIEILEKINTIEESTALQKKIDLLRKQGILVFLKTFDLRVSLNVDGVILKGYEGAGRSKLDIGPLDKVFIKLKNKYPNLMIIPSGGISSPEQVKYYIDNGAVMVGVGTLFAACKESSVSLETKEKIIASNSKDLKRFNNGQLALIFKEQQNDDFNHTASLTAGIKNPLDGHIFLGKGVDSVNEILTASDVVNNLIKNL